MSSIELRQDVCPKSGSADLSLGIKWALTPQCGIRPQMAIITQMFVPSGDSDFTLDETLPGINLIYSWDLSDRLSFAGNTQGIRFVDDSGHGTTELAQSLTIGVSITEQLGSYIEWFGLFPHSSNDPNVVPLHVLDGGFTYLITNNVQYDIRGELGLNSAAPDYGVGTGLSVRF